MKMIVNCNNKKIELEEGTTVAQLIQSLNYRRAAVWINGEQLLASAYEARVISQEDQIKILRIVAGG
jgi:thiamine biosynthesis protein ThiS